VQKLLELELKNAPEGPLATSLLIELADVLSDAGDYEKATSTYARALGMSGGTSEEARACLTDMQVDANTWMAHLTGLLEQADTSADPKVRARLYMRAARIAKRFSPGDVESLLVRAYEADPSDKQAAAIFEQMLIEEDRTQAIADTQRRILEL